MKQIKFIITSLCILFFTGCSVQKPNPVTAIAEDKSEYIFLSQKVIRFKGDYMFLVHYLSNNPDDEKVRSKEFDDIYGIIATNTDPASELGFIGLEAINKTSPTNDVRKLKGFRDYRTFVEVMKLVPDCPNYKPGKKLMKWPPE